MQNASLDIVIIGLLVLLFASTYRKRATSRVRKWTIGWVLILIHFTALLFQPLTVLNQSLLQVVSISALIACGIVFLLAAFNDGDKDAPPTSLAVVTGASGICFVVLQTFGVAAAAPYLIVVVAGAMCWLCYILSLRGMPVGVVVMMVVCIAASTNWLVWTVKHGRQDIGVSAILGELFLSVALVYMGRFCKVSGGRLTVFLGLLAWGAVFPVAEFCQHLGILSHISPEIWNVPKYFVAFGMMLVLLEEDAPATAAGVFAGWSDALEGRGVGGGQR